MSPAAAQLQFGAEFLGFLAAIAGVALALLRAAPRRPPPAVAIAFGVLAGVAFVAGSRLVQNRSDPLVSLPRLLGALVLAVGVLLWSVESRTKVLLLAGAVATGCAVPLVALDQLLAADAAVAIGGLSIGAAVLDLGRRSIASRIAVSGGASLLVIVLVLSVALSAVVDSNLRREAVKRLDDRATAEAKALKGNLGVLLRVATLSNDRLAAAAGASRNEPADRARADQAIERTLSDLSSLSLGGEAYLYIGADNTVLGEDAQKVLSQAGSLALRGDSVVRDASCPSSPGFAVVVLNQRAYGVASIPVCGLGNALFGRLVALLPLDDGRLAGAIPEGDTTSLALFGANGLVAQSGSQPDPGVARSMARLVLADNRERSAAVGDRFVSVAPISLGANEPPPLALVASSPTADISETRDGLFRALFAIALLGALIALLLAALVGERIGARLRRLTQAAEALGRGDPGIRTGVTGDDELGTLGLTFDDMASAIEEKTEVEGRLRGRLEAVVGEMGEALLATDAHARITDFNRSAEDLVGISAASALGCPISEIVSLVADDGSNLAGRLNQPPRTQWSTSASITPIDGSAVPVAVSGAPLRDPDGAPAGGVFVLRDLRGEREVERMKSEFLSRIGHELRTPLTGVLGYSEMLLRRDLSPEQSRPMVEEVVSAGHRLERIVQLLEFFAGSAAGRTLLRLEPVDVRTLVDGVLGVWLAKVEPPLTLTRRVARGLPTVLGDARLLGLALSEAVDNAIRFSPAGGKVVLSAVRADDGRVEIVVTDHGVGMTVEEVERAFKDFEQGDTSDTRSYGGLGLGLPLVLRVVEGHGGEVRCASTPGRGTRLSLFLPVLPAR